MSGQGREGNDGMARHEDERFADWVDERMSVRDLERFEAEMGVNPDLRRRAEAYRETVLSVRSALRAGTTGIDIADRVMAAVAAEPRTVGRTIRGPWQSASKRALIASSLVAAGLLGMLPFLFQWERAPASDEVASQEPSLEQKNGSADELDGRVFDSDVGVRETDRSAGLLADKSAPDLELLERSRVGAEPQSPAESAEGMAGNRDPERNRDRVALGSPEARRQEGAVAEAPLHELPGASERPSRGRGSPVERRSVEKRELQPLADVPEGVPGDAAVSRLPTVRLRSSVLQRGVGDVAEESLVGAASEGAPTERAKAQSPKDPSAAGATQPAPQPENQLQPKARELSPPKLAQPRTADRHEQELGVGRFMIVTGRSEQFRIVPLTGDPGALSAKLESQDQNERLLGSGLPGEAAGAAESGGSQAPVSGVELDERQAPSATTQAWLVEGEPKAVAAYLAKLAEAARAGGYELDNGEVLTESVELMMPAEMARKSLEQLTERRDGNPAEQAAPAADPAAGAGAASSNRSAPRVRVVIIVER